MPWKNRGIRWLDLREVKKKKRRKNWRKQVSSGSPPGEPAPFSAIDYSFTIVLLFSCVGALLDCSVDIVHHL
jgi:hypothetical protein